MQDRKLVITSTGDNRIFKDSKNCYIICSFYEKNCSPDCAACEQTGSYLKAVCNRGDFDIGVIAE